MSMTPLTGRALSRTRQSRVSDLVAAGVERVRVVLGLAGERLEAAELTESGSMLFGARADAGAVGALLTNDRPTVEVILGALHSGVTLVSLPLPGRAADLGGYVAFLRETCAEHGVSEIVASDDLAPQLEQAGLPVRRHLERTVRPLAVPSARGFELVQYTSGATARPKAVAITDRELGANVQAILEVVRPRPGDNLVSWLPLAHDMGLIGMLLTGLAAGGSEWAAGGDVVLIDPREFLRRPAQWIDAMSRWRAAFTAAPDFGFRMAADRRAAVDVDLSSLRCAIVGGEIVRAGTLRAFTAAFGSHGFDEVAFCPAYGMAEIGLAATLTAPDERWHDVSLASHALAGDELRPPREGESSTTTVACGSPLSGYEVSAGVLGGCAEPIAIRGPSVGADGVTRRRLSDSEGWYRPGDLGFFENGELHICGRVDDYVVAHGRNLHAPTVEAAVGGLDGVRAGRVVAAGLPTGEWVIVAEPSDPAPLSVGHARTIRREIRRVAVDVAAVRPDEVVLAERGTLPLTASGKLQRQRARALLLAGDLG